MSSARLCLTITVGLMFVFTCSESYAQQTAKPSRAEARFNAMDTNSDGKVSHDEFISSMQQSAERMFKKRDKDGDGFLSKEELQPKPKEGLSKEEPQQKPKDALSKDESQQKPKAGKKSRGAQVPAAPAR